MTISNTRGIDEFLSGGSYCIPNYQRSYTWTSQVQDLWEDLLHIAQSYETYEDIRPHFFGQIVIHKDEDEKKNYIVDGQQRTATSIILFAVIRDKLKEISNYMIEKGYHISEDENKRKDYDNVRRIIGNIEIDIFGIADDGNTGKLKFNFGSYDDKEYFKNNIQAGSPDLSIKPTSTTWKKMTPPVRKIHIAYKYLWDKITEEVKSCENLKDQFNTIRNLYTIFKSKFQIIALITTDLADAYDIFESLNARGKELDTADLLKNHLFKISTKNSNEIQEKWNKIIDAIGTDDLTQYIRYYWNATQKFSTERLLYREIREKINDEKKCLDFISDLSELVDTYEGMCHPDDASDSIFNSSSEIKDIVWGLWAMKVSIYQPILLALAKKMNTQKTKKINYTNDDVIKILHTIEVLVFRNIIITDQGSNKFERKFSQLAQEITTSATNKTDSIIQQIKAEIVNDDLFIPEFLQYSASNSSKEFVRYFFTRINDSKSPDTKCDAKTIEHILPQKPKEKDWDITPEDHRKYLWRLGNITLLRGAYNARLSNKAFLVKLNEYYGSIADLWSTKMLKDYQVWGPNEIEERQNKLSEEALKIWPADPTNILD